MLQKQQPLILNEEANVIHISVSVSENIESIKQYLGAPNDLVIRQFHISMDNHLFAMIGINGLIDIQIINEQVLQPLLLYFSDKACISDEDLFVRIENEILPSFDLQNVQTLDDALLSILSGDTALFVDGFDQVLIIGSRGGKSRAVEEPETESLIRGPREGFTEDIRTNTALIRKRLREPNLRFVTYKIGRRSKKEVVIIYIQGIAHSDLIKEVQRRVESIDIDDLNGSGTVEQWISDSFLSPFPIVANTERPDKVAGGILQGQIAILVDRDPYALLLPITFSSNIQSPEDFNQHWLISTATRVLRMVAAFISTFLPALYIALLEYHHGMIPSKLAFSIAGSREGVPFPAVVEAFAMEGTLELLREAGIRLPKQIGQTIGIVGGLVIGEAAVSAGVVSPIMVIVVAITAIASFSFPSYSFAISLRLVRFGIMVAASVFGLYGIILAYIMINIHFVNLKSFGIPYSTPFAPLFFSDWKDLILRAPVTFLTKRPQMMQTEDVQRADKE